MAFALSPGVVVTETDLTNIVPAVATTAGAFAGSFQWGPVEEVTVIDSEKKLVELFGKPDANTAVSFFTAANYLSYGNNLQLVRVVGTAAKNAVSSGTALLIKNEDVYQNTYVDGFASVGTWAAKYAGARGNSIKVSIADSATFTNMTGTGTVTTTTSSTAVTGVGTAFLTQLHVGAIVKNAAGTTVGTVASIASDTAATLAANAAVAIAGAAFKTDWAYATLFDSVPATSASVSAAGGSNDEMHIIVIDEDGVISGTTNTVLAKYAFVSKASDAKKVDGSTNFYKNVINDSSSYIWWMDHPTVVGSGTAFGSASAGSAFKSLTSAETISLTSGVSDDTLTDAMATAGFAMFANDELYDVSLIPLGGASATVASYVINNIAETRRDCVVFVSPTMANVVNNTNDELADVTAFRNSLPSSSYAVIDSGWKYQYDRYNDVYRWIPLNGDIAGTCVRTDAVTDPWFSPGGMNRGQIKNIVKLAWSPTKTDRDYLYKIGINPVVSFPGQGTVLFGDKTMLSRPSAFDRINVRRLFIILEKAIATAAKYQLFELNDTFTRAQFRNMVEPFLRDVQGRRGITDFAIVCDDTNNTGEVIDRNEFIADIYVKPTRSINFISLNFIATRTGVAFSEVGA